MDALQTWFDPLNAAVAGSDSAAEGIGPDAEETKLLLDIGKIVAARGPQRYYAMLTAFSIGRALGRAEATGDSVEGPEFLRRAAASLEELAPQTGRIDP